MKKIFFTKMQGQGNDFVLLDWEEYQEIDIPLPELSKILCDRRFGVGADGLLVVVPDSTKADLGWLYYNSDGTVAKMNGTDMRCFAKYAFNKGYVEKTEFSVETEAGVILAKINTDGTVAIAESADNYMIGPAEFTFEGIYFNK